MQAQKLLKGAIMNTDELLALYDKEQRIEIEYPGVQKEAFPDLVRFVRPAPGMNYVSYSRLDEATMDATIQQQIAFFCQMDQPFSWHIYDHDMPPNLGDRLVEHGFMADDDPDAVMVLDVREASPALLEPVGDSIRLIAQQDQLDDVARIEEQVWGGDFAWLKKRLAPHLEIPGYLSVYVAYVEEQPACSGWVYFHPNSQFAGLFGGATVAEHRKLGLYTAVLATRVQEAIRRGYRFLTTGASPMSQPILAKNGFRLLTHAYAYEWKR
jgi:hypothetical protein